MIRVLITDTHFGWKQNSVTWINSQIKFIDEQVIPKIKELKKKDKVRLIHLGDVFDSRSSINPMIAKITREKFAQLRSLVDDFYIIAGNHDFYSPNSDDIDSLTMVFQDMDINLVVKEAVCAGEDAFIPWYVYKDTTWIPAGIKNIFTHADIFGDDRKTISGVKILSGHIHTPMINDSLGLYNLGSCYSLNFSDSNQERYFYVLDNELHKIANKHSIRFWRLKDEQIFDEWGGNDDYYELYISQSNMQTLRYQQRLAEFMKSKKNTWRVPVSDNLLDNIEQFETYDINAVCKEHIPDHLQPKFKQIESYINSHSTLDS